MCFIVKKFSAKIFEIVRFHIEKWGRGCGGVLVRQSGHGVKVWC